MTDALHEINKPSNIQARLVAAICDYADAWVARDDVAHHRALDEMMPILDHLQALLDGVRGYWGGDASHATAICDAMHALDKLIKEC